MLSPTFDLSSPIADQTATGKRKLCIDLEHATPKLRSHRKPPTHSRKWYPHNLPPMRRQKNINDRLIKKRLEFKLEKTGAY